MKTLSCDLCDHVVEAATFGEWMEALKPHYKEAHADFMAQHAADPDGGKAKMMQWVTTNEQRFEEALESN